MRVASALLLTLSVTWSWAQQPQPSLSPHGSVADRLVDAETKLPLRFAEIRLIPKPTQAELV